MNTLEKRLQFLERASQSALGIRMVVRKIVDVGHLGAEGTRCTFEGQEWHRANDESEDQMLDRVYDQIKLLGQIFEVVVHAD